MPKAKATHSGTCQICGRSQKLPNGSLAKHGYTTRWGFFEGVCPGSHFLPFEVSCNLIEGIIRNVTDQRKAMIAQQAKLREPATESTAWVNEYHMARNRGDKSEYRWREAKIASVSETYGTGADAKSYTHYIAERTDGKPVAYSDRIQTSGFYPETVLEVCTYLNARKADSMQKRIDELANYIAWQKNRVATWKPGTLTPVA